MPLEPATSVVIESRYAPPAPVAAPDPIAPAPVDTNERVAFMDALRGFALWGVCLANLVPWFAGYDDLPEKAQRAISTWPVDRVTTALLRAFVHGRFITIFSFLFGLGFAIQFLRAESRGADATRLLTRRLAVMLGIGAVHAVAIWYGDILVPYALCGMVLLLARRWPVKRLLAVGATLVLLVPIAWSAFTRTAPVFTHGTIPPMAAMASADSVMRQQLPALVLRPSYTAVVELNVRRLPEFFGPWIAPSWLPYVAGLFLLGLCVGRAGLLRRLDTDRETWRTVFRWAAVISLLGYGARLVIELTQVQKQIPQDVLGMIRVIRIVGEPTMSLAYVTGLVLLFQRPAWRRHLMYLAPVGRMALSNYLTQSILGVLLFNGIGFGLYHKVGPTVLVAWSLVLIAMQAVVSRWWLARYRFGPAEWLWRALTYGRRQPMRVAT